MDIIHQIMNIALPPMVLTVFFLSTYMFLKLLLSTIKFIVIEDVAGKVVLITEASSGIGKQLAYEYASRGAFLALVARRENRLREIALKAYELGSPGVIVIPADVSNAEDCKRIVDVTVNHFGQLDHLVSNVGVVPIRMFEKANDNTNFATTMDSSFWGSAYGTYFAVPHLKRSKGKIVAIASAAGWLPARRLSFYNASKAAMISLYEILRVDIGRDIGITIVTSGLIESEMTQRKILSKDGQMVLGPEMRDALISIIPIAPLTECAKAIVNAACRGEKHLTEPSWVSVTRFWRLFFPDIVESNRLGLPAPGSSERDTPSKKLLEKTGLKKRIYPSTVQFPELRTEITSINSGPLNVNT